MNRLKNNQFLEPIIQSLNEKELFFFIVLFGLLPSIADYSLFKFTGISALNYFFTNPYEVFGYGAIAVQILFLIIGLYLIYKGKRYYYLLGLLPILLSVVLFLSNFLSYNTIELFAIVGSILSKIAFLFFIFKGKIRSLSFVTFIVLMFFVLYNAQIEISFFQSIKQSILFIFFCIIFKFIYIWFSQNIKTFAKVKRKRLLLLTLRSILVWSPILLFALPAEYISRKFEENAINAVYNNSGITRHYAKSKLKFKDLYGIRAFDTLQKYSKENKFYTRDVDSVIEKKQFKFLKEDSYKLKKEKLLIEVDIEPYKSFNNSQYFKDLGQVKMNQKQATLINSLVFINHKLKSQEQDSLAKLDFVKVSKEFKNTYSILQKSKPEVNDSLAQREPDFVNDSNERKNLNVQSLDRADYFIMEFVAYDLEKIIINKRFPGKSGLELDAILSIHESLSASQEKANQRIDKSNDDLNKQIDNGKEEADKKVNDFIQDSNLLAQTIGDENLKTRKAIIDKTNEINQRFSDSLTKKLDTLSSRARQRMEAAPEEARELLDTIMPIELSGIISYFEETPPCTEPEDIGWLDFLSSPDEIIKWIGCRVELMFKKSQNEKYREIRKESLKDVKEAVANFLDKEAIEAVEASIQTIKKKTDSLNNLAASEIVKLTTDASGKAKAITEKTRDSINNIAKRNAAIILNEINKVQTKVNKQTAKVKVEINKQYENAKDYAAKGVMATNRAIEMNKLFGNLLLALIIFKSFFYVFSRVAFNKNEELYVSVIKEPKTYKNGIIEKLGITFSIPANHKETYFVVRKFRPTGRAPKIGIHCWTASIIRRLRTRTFLMNHISVKRKTNDSIDFSALAGKEFIEWSLADGEEVVFDYSNLVALTSTIKLKSDLSLRLTSTLFGKSFFHIATGPGKLILMTKGHPITDNKLLQKSLHIDRLVAWQKCTEFSVVSELNIVDIYFSGLYLQRSSKDMIIIDADETSKKRAVGMARFISKFIFPT